MYKRQDQVYALLQEVEAAESLTDEDAQEKHDALLALMEESQQAKTEAVSIPYRRSSSRGRGGGSGGRGGSSRGSRGSGEGSSGASGASSAGGTNLFREGSGADAIQALLLRLAPQEAAEKE